MKAKPLSSLPDKKFKFLQERRVFIALLSKLGVKDHLFPKFLAATKQFSLPVPPRKLRIELKVTRSELFSLQLVGLVAHDIYFGKVK